MWSISEGALVSAVAHQSPQEKKNYFVIPPGVTVIVFPATPSGTFTIMVSV
jgi:hypothetical protein